MLPGGGDRLRGRGYVALLGRHSDQVLRVCVFKLEMNLFFCFFFFPRVHVREETAVWLTGDWQTANYSFWKTHYLFNWPETD